MLDAGFVAQYIHKISGDFQGHFKGIHRCHTVARHHISEVTQRFTDSECQQSKI